MTTTDKSNRSLIWDWPLRAFHWLLTVCFLGSWITAEAGIEWAQTHLFLGYCTLGLIIFRLVWGVLGPKYSRFTQFVRGCGETWRSLSELPMRSANPHVGHSPIGGWASLLLIGLIGVQATSGLFITDDIFNAGPYNSVVTGDWADRLGWLHHTNFDVLLIAIAAHLVVISWYRLGKNHNLVLPMITGSKPVHSALGIPSSRSGLAFAIALLVGLFVYLLVQLAPEPEYFF